jgi:dienelactone hydrolase
MDCRIPACYVSVNFHSLWDRRNTNHHGLTYFCLNNFCMKSIAILLSLLYAYNVRAQGRFISYTCDTAKLKGYYSPPQGKTGKGSGIIIVHAWMGITDHEKQSADKLSKLGHHVLAADVFGENVRPAGPKEAGALAGYYKKNIRMYHAKLRAAYDQLVKQGADPAKIVMMGYCFGGTGAIEAARMGLPVKGIVSFHGGLGRDTSRAVQPIAAKMLILHGADDPYVPEAEVIRFRNELRAAGADWQMVYYSRAVHAFTDPSAGNDNSKGAAYNKEADERSWKAMLAFLEEIFRS